MSTIKNLSNLSIQKNKYIRKKCYLDLVGVFKIISYLKKKLNSVQKYYKI